MWPIQESAGPLEELSSPIGKSAWSIQESPSETGEFAHAVNDILDVPFAVSRSRDMLTKEKVNVTFRVDIREREMATIIQIAERFINLDRLVYAQWDAGSDGARAKLSLIFERGERRWVEAATQRPAEERDVIPLNMTFYGADAEEVRNSLQGIVKATWQLPSGDQGFWPKLPF